MTHPTRTAEQIRDYIESKVLKVPGGCWIWLGLLTKDGYGRLAWKRPGLPVLRRAHRVAFAAYHGEPGNLLVCHTCDVRACCNPDHLFLGTHAENMADRNAKGRQARGTKVAGNVLTEDQVLEVRRLVADGMAQKDVAAHYGVSRGHVSHIVNGSRWSHT